MAEEYAAELDRNPWNSLYERPGTVALLPPVAGRQVLDVGCGPGSLSAWLARNGARVTGFDASAAMVELAEKRAIPSASFVVADLAEPLASSPTTPSTSRWPAWSCTTCGIGLPRCASCAESYDRTARSSFHPPPGERRSPRRVRQLLCHRAASRSLDQKRPELRRHLLATAAHRHVLGNRGGRLPGRAALRATAPRAMSRLISGGLGSSDRRAALRVLSLTSRSSTPT